MQGQLLKIIADIPQISGMQFQKWNVFLKIILPLSSRLIFGTFP